MKKVQSVLLVLITVLTAGCQTASKIKSPQQSDAAESYYGTLAPFASESVYFLMTDRFVDGDTTNNQQEQGGNYPTYQRMLSGEKGEKAYVGYMGGDFKGILNNADYISEMGFTAIWLTPIVDQPDEAFNGGEAIRFGESFKDGGKTGYHGYWGVNFFEVDEHLPSKDLSFNQLTTQLREQYQIKTVLDIVTNHGSPAYTMRDGQQPKFGQIYNQRGELVADHQNLSPEELKPDEPLHQFYSNKPDIMQLSDLDPENSVVLDYFVQAYLHWIKQGADAFRIDTIKHMPHQFWKKFSDRIRQENPAFFMFAESYSFDAEFIAQHTLPENGDVSVLDFPGRETMLKIFENPASDYSEVSSYLHLTNGPYKNPYELMTFYDNHDMSRMKADQNGFIDAHNWLFTARGIPVIYYGSEMGFMSGTSEHQGNRNYFGEDNIKKARSHPIRHALKKVATLRKNTIALQRGLQVNLELAENKAAFYRVYQKDGINQTALVMLNKGDTEAHFSIDQYMVNGEWKNPLTGESKMVVGKSLDVTVAPHSLEVYLYEQANTDILLKKALNRLMENKSSL